MPTNALLMRPHMYAGDRCLVMPAHHSWAGGRINACATSIKKLKTRPICSPFVISMKSEGYNTKQSSPDISPRKTKKATTVQDSIKRNSIKRNSIGPRRHKN